MPLRLQCMQQPSQRHQRIGRVQTVVIVGFVGQVASQNFHVLGHGQGGIQHGHRIAGDRMCVGPVFRYTGVEYHGQSGPIVRPTVSELGQSLAQQAI